ncbi:NAC domain-containing protein 104-like [Lycium barbarum]|uniref:NAC domain-containing protein 104-like n=1 Tax=Lycium barbarum TaxID=112863 RepID=UPI00293EEADC|nr:NAC domain-containing protein 104-like [Lycium barbarum]
MEDNNNVNLPPGFRFSPSDEELIVHFLHRKSSLLPCHPDVIPDLHLHPYDPWDLDGKAMAGGNKWYFYSRRTHETRITSNGYWQSLGVDETIWSSSNHNVGMKKHYAFYMGEPPQGHKTNWLMQEYMQISDSSPSASSSRSSSSRRRSQTKIDYNKWVICRVYESNSNSDDNDGAELSCLDEVFLSLDDLDDDEISLPHN